MIPVIIDTDPGIDDAAALVMALTNEKLNVKLITTVAGNVNVEKTTNNTLKLVEFLGLNIPVAKGAEKPLVREYEDASYIHGESGMDGYDFKEPARKEIELNAVDAIGEELLKTEEKITIVTLGTLTNIALLIEKYPEYLNNIEEIIIMGGALKGGNTTSVAEFNIYGDPDAAKIVFESGLPLTMIGLDVTEKAVMTKETVMKLRDMNSTGYMLYSLFNEYKGGNFETGLYIHDACTIYYILNREKVKTKKYFVEIATTGPAMGATVADIRNAYHNGEVNCKVGLHLDKDDFNNWFLKGIKSSD